MRLVDETSVSDLEEFFMNIELYCLKDNAKVEVSDRSSQLQLCSHDQYRKQPKEQ